jgi:hypothetical protein
MAVFSGKQIVRAVFTSGQKDSIEVVYNHKDEGEEPEYISVWVPATDPTNEELKGLIEEGWTFDRIQTASVEYYQSVRTAQRQMFEKIVGEQYIIDLKASIAKEFEERYTQPTSILETVINNDTNEDVLFKTKLAIFEIPQVKNITDKVLKQEIRTATSLLQLFSLLNNIMKSSNNDEPAPES